MSDSQDPRVTFKDCPGAIAGDLIQKDCEVIYVNKLDLSRKSSFDAFVDQFCAPEFQSFRYIIGGILALLSSLSLLVNILTELDTSSLWWLGATPGMAILACLSIYAGYRIVSGSIKLSLQCYGQTPIYALEKRLYPHQNESFTRDSSR